MKSLNKDVADLLQSPLGSASSPSLSFVGDPNTGIYSPGADQLAISTGGTGRLFITSAGDVCLGSQVGANNDGSGLSIYNTSFPRISFRNSTTGNTVADGSQCYLVDSDFYVTNNENAALIFRTNSTERLRITSTGALNFVGAGTAGSTQAVSFNGSAPINSLVIDSSGRVGIGTAVSGDYSGDANNLVVQDASGNGGITIRTPTSNAGAIFFADGVFADPGAAANRGMLRYDHSDDSMQFWTAGNNERARIDSSGRLLVGTSSSLVSSSLIQVAGNSYPAISINSFGSASNPEYLFRSARGTQSSPTASSDGDKLGAIYFQGYDGAEYLGGAKIEAFVDGAVTGGGADDLPGRLVFSTTADGVGSPTERMRIASGGRVSAPSWYDETTAVAANVNVASTGILQRSTSSIKYKTNVETIEDSYSDALLNCRPVWYRSTCTNDNPNYGWWGFIAEEVAEIDPRLCFFEQKEDGNLEPEGVAYDRFVPHLLNLIKRQGEAIAELQAEVAALKGA